MQTPEHNVNFVAPHAPDTCAALLHEFANAYSSLTVRTRTNITRFSNGCYHFSISRSFYSLPTHRRPGWGSGYRKSNYVKLQVDGYLVKWPDSGSTIVIAAARINPKTFVINGIILLLFGLVMLALTVFFLAEFICLAPVVFVMLISFAHTTVFQPEALGQKYKRTLIQQIIRTLH